MFKKENIVIVLCIILAIILTCIFPVNKVTRINSKNNNNSNIGVKNKSKNEEVEEKAKYKYEGTYRASSNHSVSSVGENVYYVAIRGENNYLNLYKCTDESGCRKEWDITCNDDYSSCSHMVNDNVEN